MTDTIVTIDRSPLSLGCEATESDVEQYRIRLEDELARALPGLTVRVVLGDSVGYDCTGETLTCEQMRTISRIWLETAKEFDKPSHACVSTLTADGWGAYCSVCGETLE